MRRRITLGMCFIVACLLVILIAARVDASGHPFLIVTPSNYQQLRDRANQSPWKEMKVEAIRKAENLSYQADQDNGREAGYKLRDVIGYTALAYILDPANQERYVNKIRTTLEVALLDMQKEHEQNEDSWNTNVAFQGGVFNAILALDIIYDDLRSEQRSNLENAIDQLVNRFIDNWGAANHSISALWALYKGDRSKLESERQEYHNAWTEDITEDGVYAPGTGYGMERINGCTREHKALGMDIWEYQGLQNYYRNEQFGKLHEWLYGYSHTPDFRRLAFGDSSPEDYLLGNQFNTANCSTQPYRAYKFSDKAQQYANWQMQDNHGMNFGNAATLPNGRLLTYLLMGSTAPEASKQQVPPSRVFSDGGAWLVENQQSRQALIGALWNVKKSAVHAHKETNAIALSGYGTHLLTNSGYRGWRNGVGEFSWNYIYDRAVSGNTGLIDYEFEKSQQGEPPEKNDHQQKYGAGITESLLTPTFDYARGDSGEALPNGQHFRNFHFVHPANGKSGYWFLVDEFTAGSKAHLAFHPYSKAINTVVPDQEYQANIVDYGNQKTTNVALTIFLGTEPDNTILHNGVIAGPNIQSQYLYPTYTRAAGIKQIVTVLFPANPDHPKPAFTRIQGDRYTGATVDQGGVVDYLLESDSDSTQTVSGVSLQAKRSFFRLIGDQLQSFYIVGKAFEYEGSSKVGVRAENDITIYLHDRSGQVSAAVPQILTLYYPNMRKVLLNGTTAAIVESGEGWIQINLPQGTSDIKLEE